MRRLRYFTLLLCLSLLSVIGIQTDASPLAQLQTLTYGQPVTTEVTGETARWRFTFEGAANDSVYVAAHTTTDEFELTVEVFSPNGTSLGVATDNALGTLVGPFTLPGSGPYTVEVSQPDYNQGVTGSFDMIVDLAPLNTIKPDGRYSGTLPYAGAVVFFSYTGRANELFGYAATGQNIGLFLRTPDGREFLENADYGTGSLENPLSVLPEDGTYIVYLKTGNPGGTDYTLRVNPIKVTTLEAGSSASGQLSSDTVQVFRFTSQIDELWRVDVIAPDLNYNSRVEIRSAADLNTYIVGDTGSGVDGAPRIDPFISTATGDYYILLRTDSATPGAFTLTLDHSTVQRLVSGVAQSGSITPDTGLITYLYFGGADEVVRVTFTATSGAPGLQIVGPVDEVLQFYARSIGTYTFEVTLPQTGLYGVRVNSVAYDGTPTDFTLTLESVR